MAERTDDSRAVSTDNSIARFSRRGALVAGGTAALTSLSGCSGLLGSSSPDESTNEGPEKPWTTEELAAEVPEDATITIYSAMANPEAYEELVSVVNDEYDTNLKPEVFVSDAGDISQRIIQEHQADSDKVDVISHADDINEKFKSDGKEAIQKYYELGLDEDYWFSDKLTDPLTEPWYVKACNGGPSVCMAVNPEKFDELGLEIPTDWNDLLKDEFEGVETYLPSYIVNTQFGWIAKSHAEEQDMEPIEWMENMYDHLSFSGIESHTRGARAVGQGKAPFMYYNFPWTIAEIPSELPVEIHLPEGILELASLGHLAINNQAPNPWAARFFVSAVLEENVQRRMINEAGQLTPGRSDIDYSDQDPGEYVQKTLNADTNLVTFSEQQAYESVGQKAVEEVISL